MEIQQQLRSLGLHQTEIAVYLFLLKNGLSAPPIVSCETGIARTNCYNILLELKNKELIEEKTVAKRKSYQANDPVSLVKLLENKAADAQKILPELEAIFTHQVASPGVKFYEGLEQIKQLYESSLSTKNILSIGSRRGLRTLVPDFEKYYFQEIQKRQITFYDLTDRESKLMTTKINMLIWDDTICFLSLKDSITAIVLKNQAISDVLQMLFKIIWKKI
ncbi:MAG: hypothetical protein HY983_01980 [Candidatus Magasanikbacteria bacterium]|nr:hypothetical protein [Candidatus Magasanikbacteria bacterium]